MPLSKSYGITKGWPLAAGQASYDIAARPLAMRRTADGSVGQVYSLGATHGGALQWTANGEDIAGATGSTYTAQAADVGKTIGVRETIGGREFIAAAAGPVLDAPILLEGFNATTGWTASAGAVLTADTANKVQGAASLQIAGTGTANPKATKASIGAFTPADLGVVAWYFRLDTDSNKQCTTSVRCAFVDSAATEHVVSGATASPSLYQTPAALFAGDYWHAYPISDLTALVGQASQTLGLAVTPTSNVPNNNTVRVDALMAKAAGRPTVIVGFDDTHASQFTVGRAIMKARGLKANVHVVKNFVGQTNRMTADQLDTLYREDGWDLCVNTTDDGPMTSKGSVAAAVADLVADRQYLLDNGWDRGANFGCYPNGAYATNGTRVLVNSVTSTGDENITLGTASPTVQPGWEVEGYNVPPGTTVLAVTDSTHFSLSDDVPAQTKPMSFTSPAPFGIGKLQTGLIEAGFRQMRTTRNFGHMHTRFGWAWHWVIFNGNGTSGLTLAAFQALIDRAILVGGTIEFYTHVLVNGGGGGNTDPTLFAQMMDYLVAKRDAGLLDVLTKSELWARDGGSSVPV